MEKKKMSLRKYLIIWLPILAILLALVIAVTAIMNFFAGTMDTYLGKGERLTTEVEGTEDWDLEYYETKYASAEGENGSQLAAAAVAKTISDEGEVLLKNDNVLPLAKDSKVTPFGYRYLSPVYGGTGSGNVNTDQDYVTTAQAALAEKFDVNESVENIMNEATPMELTTDSYAEAQKQESEVGFTGAGTSILEFDPAIYEDAAASCEGTTGIVFIGRVGGEGSDLQSTKYYDNTPHQLALSTDEKETIAFAKENCDKVVVIINSSNVMEVGPLLSGEYEADAILWIGGPGAKGFASMADILCGDVNPSGKTPDIYAMDHTKDPSFVNFGRFDYTNAKTGMTNRVEREYFSFIEYEEGIYIGYRYYETRAAVDDSFDYDANVAYPFGYGLSYTEFTQTITDYDYNDDEITVKVNVANAENGKAGKDTVQIYYTAPYTTYDRENGIEKSEVVLAGFAKTDVIQPGDSDEVTITFPVEDMASYSYKRSNPDGTTGAYMLEAGEYTISLRSDSHNVIDTRTYTVDDTIWYDGDNPRQSEKDAQALLNDDGTPTGTPAKAQVDKDAEFIAATNRFDELNDYMDQSRITKMSRSDFAATYPTAPTEFVASDEIVANLNNAANPFDIENDKELGNTAESLIYHKDKPVSNADNGLTLSSMRGLDYYDEAWNDLLDQIDYTAETELNMLLLTAAFKTYELTSVGKPETIDHDGPQGLSLTGTEGNWGAAYAWCAYASSPVLAATFNVDLAYDMGEAIGQEALTTGVTGWYAPGLNTHRTPFGGRSFEYYSEDALLAGKICARVASGAADCGVITYVKHFAANEQETKRAQSLTWMTEQTLREIYLRPFEIYVKEATMTIKYIADDNGTVATKVMRGALGMMTSMNYIGTRYAGCSYDLVTSVLRNEWGFQGAIITDMTGQALDTPERAMRAGTDMWMWYSAGKNTFADLESATAQYAVRNAIHNICYATVNSNIMNGAAPGAIVYYTMSPWAIWLMIGNIIIYAFIIVMSVFIVRRVLDTKKHPEKYEQSK